MAREAEKKAKEAAAGNPGDGNPPTPAPSPNPEPQPPTPAPVPAPQADLDEAKVFEFLSKKVGKDVKSIEDLKSIEKVEVERFASDEVRAMNEWVKSTGRTVSDYQRVKSLQVESMSQEEVIKQAMKLEDPALTDKQVDVLYKRKFVKQEADDHMDDDERRKIEEENELVEISLRKESEKAKKSLGDYISKLSEPVQNPNALDETKYNQSWSEHISKFDGLYFDLGGEKFEWKISDEHKQELKSPLKPEEFIGELTKSDGTYDVSRIASLSYLEKNIPAIIKSAVEQGKAIGMKQIADGKDLGDRGTPGGNPQDTPADAMVSIYQAIRAGGTK